MSKHECSKCGKSQPHSEFPQRANRPLGRASHCQDCERERQREYYAQNKARIAPIKAARAAEWYEQNADRHKNNVESARKKRRKPVKQIPPKGVD